MVRRRESNWFEPHAAFFVIIAVILLGVRLVIYMVDSHTESEFDKRLTAWSVASTVVAQKYEFDVLTTEKEHRLDVESRLVVYDQAVKRQNAVKQVLTFMKEHPNANDIEESENGRFVADLSALFKDVSSTTDRSSAYSRLQQPELYGEAVKTGFYQNGQLDVVSVEQVLKQVEGISVDLAPVAEPVLPEYVAPAEPMYPPHPEEWEPDVTWFAKVGFFNLRSLAVFWWLVSLCSHLFVLFLALVAKEDLDFRVSESIEKDETSDNRSSYLILQVMYLPIVLPALLISLFLPVFRELALLPLAGFRKYRHRLYLWKKIARWSAVRSHVHFHQMQELRELLSKAQTELKALSDERMRKQLRDSISELDRSITELEKAGTVIDPESLDAREQMGRVAVLRGKIDAAISSAKGTLVAQKEVETVR